VKRSFIMVLSIFGILLPIIPGMAGAVELTGFLTENLGMKFQDEQEFIREETLVRLRLRKRTESATLLVSVDLLYDPLYYSSPDVGLREAYAEFSPGRFDVRIGRQITIWGRADELNPTDFINPENYRQFILSDKADRKIGSFYTKVDYYFGAFSIRGIFIPVFTPAEIPMETTSPWIPYEIKKLLMNPSVTLDDSVRPGFKLKNSEYAFKLDGVMPGFDFSLCYFDGFFDLPIMFRTAVLPSGTVEITPEYRRFRAGGFDFSTALGGAGLWGEVAYIHRGYYTTVNPADADGIVVKPYLSFIAGADYTVFENLYLNFQWFGEYIFDYEKAIDDDMVKNGFIFECSKTFSGEELKIGFTGMIYNLKDEDYMLKPYIEYSYADGILLETGGYFFGGKKDSMFGQFDTNDNMFLKISYYF